MIPADREIVSLRKKSSSPHWWLKAVKSKQLYLMLLLPIIYFCIFQYYPMAGIQIAFKKFHAVQGIWGSPWVGFSNFHRLFHAFKFWQIVRNTVSLSIYELLVGFPFPIVLALAINSIRSRWYKKFVQMMTYSPHFISTVVIIGIAVQFLDYRLGIVNTFIKLFGGDPVNFLGKPAYFQSIFVWSDVWQNAGWGTIIYLAVLSSVNPSLYEASIIDGAGRFKRIIHIDVPALVPTIVVLFILRTGHLMNVQFEKVLLLQTPLNLSSSEVLQTYVYKVGLASSLADYSFATTIGLFTSVINFILIVVVNQIARKTGDYSLW